MESRNSKLILLIFSVFFFFFQGCVLIEKGPQLSVLRDLGQSQEQMERHVQTKKDNLKKLIEDINQNRLEPGLSYREITFLYGRPVLERNLQEEGLSLALLYRHPIQYFSGDRIYLYFDQNENLSYWDYQPEEENINNCPGD